MTVDAGIVAIFGEPPVGIDLTEQTTSRDNTIVVCLCVLALVSFAGRIWARRIKGAPLWLDDWLVLISLVLLLGTLIITVLGGNFMIGHHIWALNLPILIPLFKTLYAYTFVYSSATTAIKLSFIFYFIRIFHTGPPLSVFRTWNLLGLSLTICTFLSLSYPIMVWGTMLGVCKPLDHFWNQYSDPTGGKCIQANYFYFMVGIINMVIDLLILLIPIPSICRLQIRRADKAMLIGIFMLGGFVCIASAIRIRHLYDLVHAKDVTWAMGPVFIWSSVEPALGILSSCLISLRPVFAKIWTTLFGTELSITGKSNPSGVAASRQDALYDGRKRRRHEDDDELALVTIDAQSHGTRAAPKDGAIHVVKNVVVVDEHDQIGDSDGVSCTERTVTGWRS